MRRIRNLLIGAVLPGALLLTTSCAIGTPKYAPPPKNYPTLFTFSKGLDDVWGAANNALSAMGFQVASANKAAGKIETKWANTGHAPARQCDYGLNSYWENPIRRQQLSIVLKKVAGPAMGGMGSG